MIPVGRPGAKLPHSEHPGSTFTTDRLRTGILHLHFAHGYSSCGLGGKSYGVIPSVLPLIAMKSVTISAKIPVSLKRKLERQKVRISEVVRAALEREVLRAEENILAERLDEIRSRIHEKLTREDILLAVRASRRDR